MDTQHTQDEDTTTETENGHSRSRSDDAPADTNDTEQADSQPEYGVDELRNAVVNKLCDMTEGESSAHPVEPEDVISIITAEYGVGRERVEEAIEKALMEGHCFEPSVSEETGDDMLFPIGRVDTSNESDQPADSSEGSSTTSQESASEEDRDASGGDTATNDIDLDQIRSFIDRLTADSETITMESIVKGVESGLVTGAGSGIPLHEFESAVRGSQWGDEMKGSVLSTIKSLREEREAQREFARKVENGEIETDTMFPTPSEWKELNSDGSPPQPPANPDTEPEPERDDTDPILEEYHDHYQPEFPGQMSGESIHLQDDDMEWREPRSLY